MSADRMASIDWEAIDRARRLISVGLMAAYGIEREDQKEGIHQLLMLIDADLEAVARSRRAT